MAGRPALLWEISHADQVCACVVHRLWSACSCSLKLLVQSTDPSSQERAMRRRAAAGVVVQHDGGYLPAGRTMPSGVSRAPALAATLPRRCAHVQLASYDQSEALMTVAFEMGNRCYAVLLCLFMMRPACQRPLTKPAGTHETHASSARRAPSGQRVIWNGLCRH